MENLFLIRYPEQPIPIPAKRKTSIGDWVKTILSCRTPGKPKACGDRWLRFQKSFSISDLGSSNGTYLNGEKLPSYHRMVLHDRDKIRIASAVFSARIVGHPAGLPSLRQLIIVDHAHSAKRQKEIIYILNSGHAFRAVYSKFAASSESFDRSPFVMVTWAEIAWSLNRSTK